MLRIALKFAYDGRNFHGYARQLEIRTVEGELIKSLVKHGCIEDTKKSVFQSGSRTDKGVSAFCNVVAFNTDVSKKTILQNLSDEYNDIIVYGVAEAGSDFNPRYAKQRQYSYYLKCADLDVDKIISAASVFTGTHNFSNFARVESFKDPIRTIDNIVFGREKNVLVIDFFAQTFLWHQIRRMVSALEPVGSGKLEEDQIISALDNPDEKVDFGLASAEPLILKNVVYDFEFEYNGKLLDKLKFFETKIVQAES